MNHPGLQELVGREVSSIEFVRDYVQIRFDGPCLSVYTMPIIRTSRDEVLDSSKPGYADALITAIGRTVGKAEDDGGVLMIECKGGPVIEIPLADEYRRTDEAATLMSGEGIIWSW
jgi:hypothetical protein